MRGVELKHIAKVQELSKDRKEFDDTPVWQTVMSRLHCRLKAIADRESIEAQQQVADTTHEVICRYTPKLSSDQRLIILGKIYHIASVVEVERARWLRLAVISRNEVECC